MSRWEPDALGRLQEAAFALFRERGYGDVTVAQIAERAGVTERTFFRHFTDKRDVLFRGSERLEATLVAAIDALFAAPRPPAPLRAILVALQGLSAGFQERRELSKLRASLVAAHAELRERELIKLASLSAALSAVLERHGGAAPAAALAAETGIAVFKVAFWRWLADAKHDFAHHVRASAAELATMARGSAPSAGARSYRTRSTSASTPSRRRSGTGTPKRRTRPSRR